MKPDEFDRLDPFQREVIVLLMRILRAIECPGEEPGA